MISTAIVFFCSRNIQAHDKLTSIEQGGTTGTHPARAGDQSLGNPNVKSQKRYANDARIFCFCSCLIDPANITSRQFCPSMDQ